MSSVTQRHTEETRLQRMESEQRRRDELRNGYARLKSALPISNQKSSKISLLDRGMRISITSPHLSCSDHCTAITYIRELETGQNNVQAQLQNAEKELNRQRGCGIGCTC
jgi:Helix-loop-helix DNA-binding domain